MNLPSINLPHNKFTDNEFTMMNLPRVGFKKLFLYNDNNNDNVNDDDDNNNELKPSKLHY